MDKSSTCPFYIFNLKPPFFIFFTKWIAINKRWIIMCHYRLSWHVFGQRDERLLICLLYNTVLWCSLHIWIHMTTILWYIILHIGWGNLHKGNKQYWLCIGNFKILLYVEEKAMDLRYTYNAFQMTLYSFGAGER